LKVGGFGRLYYFVDTRHYRASLSQ